MSTALALGVSGLGTTRPNPSVGCVLVKAGRIIATGRTQPGGRPHAERIALDLAGPDAQGATAYVTLEPCAHTGQTPPCAEGLIEAGIARCVIACVDPDPRTAGHGISLLRRAGIEVLSGLMETQASQSHVGFFTRLKTGRPFVAIDPNPSRFEASLSAVPDSPLEDYFKSLGRDGFSRVRLVPGSALALAADAQNLVDAHINTMNTPY